MKKFLMCMAGAMMVLSLAACTPTEVESGKGETIPEEGTTLSDGTTLPGGTALPGGVTPDMLEHESIDPDEARKPDPNAPKMDAVMIFYPNDEKTGLENEMIDVEIMDEDTVAEYLIQYGVLPADTVVNFLDIEGPLKPGPGVPDEETGTGDRIGTLELTQIDTLEGIDEKLMIYSIVNSYCENFQLDKMQILIEGEPYTTSLSTDGYLYPIDKYDSIS